MVGGPIQWGDLGADPRQSQRPARPIWPTRTPLREGEDTGAPNSLERKIYDTFGVRNRPRSALLPISRRPGPDGGVELAWPQVVVDAMGSLALPSHALEGGDFDERDVGQIALDTTMGGAMRAFGRPKAMGPGRATLSSGFPGGAKATKPGRTKEAKFRRSDPEEFAVKAKAAAATRTPSERGAVDILSAEKYADGHTLRILEDGTGGYSVAPDGELNSVIKSKNSNVRGFAPAMLDDAVENGATWLSGFDTTLPGLYAKGGFRPVARIPWDDALAPKGWDYAEMAKYNEGRPDLVFMVHDPSYKGSGKGGRMFESYDQAMAVVNEALGAGAQIGKSRPASAVTMGRYSAAMEKHQALKTRPAPPAGPENVSFREALDASREEVLAARQAVIKDSTTQLWSRDAGSMDRYRGAGEDRSGFSHLRYDPGKLPPRMQKGLAQLRDPTSPQGQAIRRDIEAGREIGMDWYNTEELLDWFQAVHGEEKGFAQWKQYMELLGTTSPGSNVMAGIGNASALRQRLHRSPEYRGSLDRLETLEQGRFLAKGRPKGYGHKTAGVQEQNTAKLMQGKWSGEPELNKGNAASSSTMVENPKPKGFIASLLGSVSNIAADLHLTRYFAMASGDPDFLKTTAEVSLRFMRETIARLQDASRYFQKTRPKNAKTGELGKEVIRFKAKNAVMDGVVSLDDIGSYPSIWDDMPRNNEYRAMENFVREIAIELDMTPAQVQASLWIGAAKRTNVHSDSLGTFMELFRRRAAYTGKKTGRTQDEVIGNFLENDGLMSGGAPVPVISDGQTRDNSQI